MKNSFNDVHFIALHGNISSPKMWSSWKKRFSTSFHALNLWEILRNCSVQEKGSFLKELENTIDELSSPEKKTVFVGYSMGGRVLLDFFCQSATEAPLLLISSHWGLSSELEKEERRNSDTAWATLLDDSVEKFFEKWNSQKVFDQDNPLNELETVFEYRAEMSRAFKMFSLSQQESSFESFPRKSPVLLVSGESDKKFEDLNEKAHAQLEKSLLYKRKSMGHRCFEWNLEFEEVLERFLE